MKIMNAIKIDRVTKIRELIKVGDNWYSRIERLDTIKNEKANRLSDEMHKRMIRLCDFLSKTDIVRMPTWMINTMIPCVQKKNLKN